MISREDIMAALSSARVLLAAADELLRRAPKSDRLPALLDDTESLLSDARNQVEALGRAVRE